jgi:hypothetical protein
MFGLLRPVRLDGREDDEPGGQRQYAQETDEQRGEVLGKVNDCHRQSGLR